jgi:hypothetical protein
VFGCEIAFFPVKGACFRTSIHDTSRSTLASSTLGLGVDDWGRGFQEDFLSEDITAVAGSCTAQIDI